MLGVGIKYFDSRGHTTYFLRSNLIINERCGNIYLFKRKGQLNKILGPVLLLFKIDFYLGTKKSFFENIGPNSHINLRSHFF